MDIRNATRRPKGTKVPEHVVDKHSKAPDTPTFNEDGTLAAPPEGIEESLIMRQYWNFLKDNGITKKDLQEILDTMLATGNVMWNFTVFDKIPVKFQVRESWVDDLIIERIDDLTAEKSKVSAIRYNNLVAEMNLASSLRQFGDATFSVKTEEDLDKSIKFIKGLNFVYRNKLVDKLAIFERAVQVATSEWALKNFTSPLMAD